MTIIEAQDLALDIRAETGVRTDVRQIGNGQWVVIWNNLFIWNAADWQRVKSVGDPGSVEEKVEQ